MAKKNDSLKAMWAQYRESGEGEGDFGDAIPVDEGFYGCQVVGGEVREVGDAQKAIVKLKVVTADDPDDVGKTISDFWNIEHPVGFRIALKNLKMLGGDPDLVEDGESMTEQLEAAVAAKACVRIRIKPQKNDPDFKNVEFKRAIEVDEDLLDAVASEPDDLQKPRRADAKAGAKKAEEAEPEVSVGPVVGSIGKVNNKQCEVVGVDGAELTVDFGNGKRRVIDVEDFTETGHAFDKKEAGSAPVEEDGEPADSGLEIEAGDEVTWKEKGKAKSGTVVSVNKRKGTVKVENADGDEMTKSISEVAHKRT